MSQPNLVESYPLSPLQQGMVFHSLYASQAGVDIEQMVCSLHEPISADALTRAWQRAADRHPILRTAFRWHDLDEPVQDVHREVTVPFIEEDLRGLVPAAAEARLAAYLRADRRQGFDLATPPLVRLMLFRRGEAEYTLVWTFHHALLDGRSFPLVLNEVFAFHEAFVKGAEGNDVAPPLPRPYRAYIDWLQTLNLAAAKTFWQTTLKGFGVPTPLPGARAAEAVGEDDYGERQTVLPASETGALYAFARENQLSVNALVQGAWALLLSRYSGETDVVFGATRACRRSALGGEGTDTMVGILINTVPLRVAVPPDQPALAWLRDVRTAWRALRDYEHTPLVKVREWSELPPSTQLFDTLLVFEDYLLDTSLRAQGGAWESRRFKLLEKTNFALTLAGYGGPELLLKLEYDRARFDDAAVERMLGHLRNLLVGFVRSPEKPIADLVMITADERRTVLFDWNTTKQDFPRERCVHELFEAQADRTPLAVALACNGETLTYRELDLRSNQLASWLRKRGVRRETLVAVCCERSIEMMVGLLAILKAGGAYVPLDPAYPKDRLEGIMADCEAKLLVTQERVRGALPDHRAELVRLDADWQAIAKESDARVPGPATADNLAYVIYTSGSTGRPKGVAIEHHSTAAMLAWAQTRFSAEELKGMLFSTSICFDLSIFEMFLPLVVGGKVIIAPNALHLPGLPERDQVTFINTVPTAINELVQMGGIPASVRTVALAGEPLLNSLAQQVYAVPSVERVWNLYGPTEDTTYSTYSLVKKGQTTPVTIGHVLSNSQAYIVDRRMQPVPIGVAGELLLGGEGLARGYLNRPELTSEKFVKNAFTDDPGARLYRTGDLVRFKSDGEMEYLGRIDHMVKVRGFRIELGEIEAVLAEHGGVKESVVVVREDTPGDKRLAAYVGQHPGESPPTVAELRAFVKQRLPDFMVPSAFVVMERLPLTPNGKIDRKALPAPDAGSVVERAYIAPSGPIEEGLAALYAKLLKLPLEKVGAGDSFFELGGHSLLALRLFSQMETRFGKKLPLATLFQAPSIQQLAKVLAKDKVSTALIEVTPRNGSGKPPIFWCGQSFAEVERLAKHMGADQPFFGLESGLFGIKNPLTHLKDVAARYVGEITAIQPEGPYLLGGFCIDGFVAFEIAQILRARGQEVALVAVVERDGPDALYVRYQAIAEPVRYHLENLARLDLPEKVTYVLDRLKVATAAVASKLRGRRGANGAAVAPSTPEPTGEAVELDSVYLARLARSARFAYVPDQPYAGRMAIFFGSETMSHIPTFLFPRGGWDKTAVGPVELHVIPGDHLSVAEEPHVHVLAAELRACVARARRAAASTASH